MQSHAQGAHKLEMSDKSQNARTVCCIRCLCGVRVQLHLMAARAESGVKGLFHFLRHKPAQTHSLTLRTGCRLILIPIHLYVRICWCE